ncbi:hypothetical protein [Bacillus sp. P14.5]|uniref:hypothetical protein n=1 Tax=Bacillus sp. P14.5 TaxID=1983400 RepID=UPI000DEA92B3|nr:hypothetical protein [Bacillus sp. P14.5]
MEHSNTGCCCPDQDRKAYICDCCVGPMENVLRQLVGRTVSIGTIDNTNGQYNNAVINSVNDFIVTFRQGSAVIALPICLVVGVQAPEVQTATLMPAPVGGRGGECDCCERPVREFFDEITEADVDVLGPAFNNLQNTIILETGEGIIKVRDNNRFIALSLCKVSEIKNFS